LGFRSRPTVARPVTATITGAVLTLLLIAGAATAAVKVKQTPAGKALARGALLTRTQLGKGWSAKAAGQPAQKPGCTGFEPAPAGVVEVGVAGSARFSQSSNGPFVSEAVFGYRTAKQAAALASGLMKSGFEQCVADDLVDGSTAKVEFTVTSRSSVRVPAVGSADAGYRAGGIATEGTTSIPVYLDTILIDRGRTLAELSISSFQQPPSASLEHRLVRAAVRRLDA
jgi:hypothetical protein